MLRWFLGGLRDKWEKKRGKEEVMEMEDGVFFFRCCW